MFQFRRFPTYAYFIQRTLTEYCSAGFPHSEISGSTVICTSPELIAACHVLRWLLMPRHSPCALISLTYFLVNKKVGKENFNPRPIVMIVRFRHFAFSMFTRRLEKLLVLFEQFELCRRQSFDKIIALPFSKKVPQLRLFPSVACSSYFWFLCSVFKVRPLT